jgi:hypothetical protein
LLLLALEFLFLQVPALVLECLFLELVLVPELFLHQPVHPEHLLLLYRRNHRMLLRLLSDG